MIVIRVAMCPNKGTRKHTYARTHTRWQTFFSFCISFDRPYPMLFPVDNLRSLQLTLALPSLPFSVNPAHPGYFHYRANALTKVKAVHLPTRLERAQDISLARGPSQSLWAGTFQTS